MHKQGYIICWQTVFLLPQQEKYGLWPWLINCEELALLDEMNTKEMLNGLEQNKENGNNKICVSHQAQHLCVLF